MEKKDDTIFALSTANGKSAVALIRLSGKLSYECVKKISTKMPHKPNLSTFNELRTNAGQTIDQTITTYFKAPKSFTGEDMVEISVHGSGAVIKKIFEIFLINQNVRLANPGEFTRRAFENNKLNLTQVEAIADIVNAETEMQRKQAISHLSGHFFVSTKEIFESLKNILANIEAIIDFSEEDLPNNLLNSIKEQIENNIFKIEDLLKHSYIGMSIRDGFLIAIIGKPNTGKSSFINCVSGKDISIVTDQPGTTRDLIESFIDVSGYPIKFVDTAGIRKSSNMIEKIGVEKAQSTSREADVNIVFVDNKKDVFSFKNIKNPIYVRSKQDLFGGSFKEGEFYNISSLSKFGIDKLLMKIINNIKEKSPKEKSYISRERHYQCLFDTLSFLKKSREEKTADLYAEDIRIALKNISGLFGGVDIEDILDIIFSDFCIGK